MFVIILVLTIILSFGAQFYVHRTVEKHKKTHLPLTSGCSSARRMLQHYNINDVTVELTEGYLSDHYDPISKKIRLSKDNYYGDNVSSVAIACHEVGHAIQHAHGYAPLKLRTFSVPLASIGSQLGIWIILLGLITKITGLAAIGVILFSFVVLFQLITLPVEFDASNRAKKYLSINKLTSGELLGASQVLNAAALTYVAATIGSIAQFIYWIIQVKNNN